MKSETEPRARKRATKPRDDGSLLAWRCVTLSVDTASRSGWAIRAAGRLLYSGELDVVDEHELAEVMRAVLQVARLQKMPAVLVLERPWGGHQNSSVVAALGAARAYWLGAWRRAGLPASCVVTVHVSTWRACVLGGAALRLKRDAVRVLEQAAARDELRATSPHADELGGDESTAILISRWAARSPQVGRVLPKKLRAQSTPLPPLARVDARERP